MGMLKYIILGVVQGATEFFPVSSSGHLVILQRLLGLSGEELALTVILHLGTLLSLIIFFFKDILNLFKNTKLLFLVIFVTIITGVIGLSGKDFFEGLFSSSWLVTAGFIFTGIILILTKKFTQGQRKDLNLIDAILVGITQAVAIIPSVSRSGMTICTLLFRGVDKEASFQFSFLIAIPAILGAALLELKEIHLALNAELSSIAAGFFSSLAAGLFSLWILRSILRKAKLHYFGYYCIFIAVITVLFIR